MKEDSEIKKNEGRTNKIKTGENPRKTERKNKRGK